MTSPTDLQTQTTAIQWTNGRGLITGATIATLFATVIGIFTSMGTWGSNGFTPTNAPNPPSLSLAGTTPIPSGSNTICATPGSVLLLDAGAAAGEQHVVQDCSNGAATAPITVNQSSDATIAGASSYQLTINGQVTGFSKTSLGPWQPF